jgi:hypothetical protein
LLITVACGSAYVPAFAAVFNCASMAAHEPKLTFLLMLMGQVVSGGASAAAMRWNSKNEKASMRLAHLAFGHLFVLTLLCQCIAVAVIFYACLGGTIGRGIVAILGGLATSPMWLALKELESMEVAESQEDENTIIDSASESVA